MREVRFKEHAIEQHISFPDFPGKPESMYFVSCPKQGLEMEAVVLHRVWFFRVCLS